MCLVKGHIIFRQTVLFRRATIASEHGLVSVYDLIALVLPPSELALNACELLAILRFVHSFGRLFEIDSSLADLVPLVNFREQSRIHVSTFELSQEVLAAILEAH